MRSLRILVGWTVASALLFSGRAFADPVTSDPVPPGSRIQSADTAVVASAQSGLALDFSAASLSNAAFVYPSQESQSPQTDPIPEPKSDWRFIAQAHFWLPLRIKGPIEVGPTSTVVDIDLKTLLDDLKFV